MRNFSFKEKEKPNILDIPCISENTVPKFEKIHHNISYLLRKINKDHFLIVHELLKKSVDKLDSETLRTLNYYNLLIFHIEGYARSEHGFIEYLMVLEDKIIGKTWRCTTRYSNFRNFHKVNIDNFLFKHLKSC